MGEGRAGGPVDPLEGLPFQVEPLEIPIEDGISIMGTTPVNKNGRIYSPDLIQRELRKLFDRERPPHPTEEFAARMFPEEAASQGILARSAGGEHLRRSIEQAVRSAMPKIEPFVVGKPTLEDDGTLRINVSARRPAEEKIVINFTVDPNDD